MAMFWEMYLLISPHGLLLGWRVEAENPVPFEAQFAEVLASCLDSIPVRIVCESSLLGRVVLTMVSTIHRMSFRFGFIDVVYPSNPGNFFCVGLPRGGVICGSVLLLAVLLRSGGRGWSGCRARSRGDTFSEESSVVWRSGCGSVLNLGVLCDVDQSPTKGGPR